jgi:hypothetical protein
MQQVGNIKKVFLSFIAAAILFSAGSASASVNLRQGAGVLQDTYLTNKSKLESNSFGLPLIVESFEHDDRVHVDVYGIFDHSFSSIADVLKSPSNWCDIVSLHPNVKACTYSVLPGTGRLTFYIGKKVYQPPDVTRQVTFQYRNVIQQQRYLDIILNAASGPFGTKGHRMRFEALPLDKARTFVHVSYEYSDSAALRLAAKLYFATVGRSKAGFTVTGTDSNGKPVYIGGPRGSIERNAVRYYFAIQTFMNTLQYPEDNRFKVRIGEWYGLTSHYRKQLYDLDKKDYLTFKTAEHKNQVTLQRRIKSGLQ